MVWLPCPYLGKAVELPPEREQHIRGRHANLLPARLADLQQALADPDEVRLRPWRPSELLFVRAVVDDELVIVVTVEDEPDNDIDPPRHWVATAYLADTPPASEVLWLR